MNNDLASGWTKHVADYAVMAAPHTGVIGRAMISMVDGKLPVNAQILDIACGLGAVALPALERAKRERAEKRGSGGCVVATDFSQGMVEEFQRRALELNAEPDLFRCDTQNGEALTFADTSFDAVFSCFGIFLFADRKAGWREALRVLRPGGTFATSVWQGPEHNELLHGQALPIMQALPARLQKPTAPGGWIDIATADALIAEVSAAGDLIDVRCRRFRTTFVFPSWQRMWNTISTNPMLGAVLTQCTTAELDVIRANALQHWKSLAGGDNEPLVLDSACNVLTATKL